MEKTIIVSEENHLNRLDKYLTIMLGESRATVQAMVKSENIIINDKPTKNNYKVKRDDVIKITAFEETVTDVVPEDIPLNIVYQDNDMLVVDKDYNMVVHPGAGNYSGTMVNALLHHVKDLQAIKGEIRPGIVHRIDKETSGLLMVAKNPKALEHLGEQLRLKTVTRKYIALVEGVIPHNLGKVNAPIGRDPKNRQKMKCVENGKVAVTNFKVLDRFEKHTLVECVLETGRTHQIRVHMLYIGYPIFGDSKYGKRKTDTEFGQYLHAQTLGFIHPTTEEYMEFKSELPEYFKEKLVELKNG